MNGSIRKTGLFFGAIAVALLMVSTVTAVEQVNNEQVMDYLDENNLEDELLNILGLNTGMDEFNPEDLETFFVEEIEKMFDGEAFLEHMTSDKFIEFLKQNYDEMVSCDAVQDILNSEEFGEVINSEEFICFLNSEEMKYVYDKLQEDDDSQISLTGQTVGVGVQQSQPLVMEAILRYDPVNCPVDDEEAGFNVLELVELGWQPGDIFAFIIVASVCLLFSLITWIPILIWVSFLGIIGIPIMFSQYLETEDPWHAKEWYAGLYIEALLYGLFWAFVCISLGLWWPIGNTLDMLEFWYEFYA